MFTANNLKEWMTAQPFRPFRVHMSDGKTFDVTDHDSAFVKRQELEVGLDPDEDGIAMRFAHCAILHITQIEELKSEQAA